MGVELIDTAYFTAFIFVFIRMMSFFSAVPVFFPKGLPNTAKIALVMMVSFLLLPGISTTTVDVSNNYKLVISVGCEITTGLTLGYITNMCFNSIKLAGQLIDMQAGLSMISMFDPSSNTNSTLIENIYYWFSVMIFFIVNAHHTLIAELIKSFDVVPIGSFLLSPKSINVILKIFSQYFAIGLEIAIPIILIILITDLTMGLVSRTVPQLNIMIFGLPIKLFLTLVCIIFSLPLLARIIQTQFNQIPDVFKQLYKVLPFAIVFAADDKTEEATSKKKSQAREKGQVAKSKEVNLALTLLATTLAITALGSYVGNNLKNYMTDYLSNYLNLTLTDNNVFKMIIISVERMALTILPFVLPIMLIGIVSNYIQVGFLFSGEPLKPTLSKINPLKGLKKIFSTRTLVELLKNIAIVSVVGYVGYQYVVSSFQELLYLDKFSFSTVALLFEKLVVGIFTKITIVLIAIALIDYIFQRRSFNKDLKMSKQEVKEEYKQQEGDPQVKGKIRQRQREMASRRMMAQVPNATVVVTNPTHIAVALRYEEGKSSAPILVAKGADNVALKIKEIAKNNDVPIIENKPLARLIYKEIELEEEIPEQMYQAIAEILALVFKMKKRK